MERWKRSRGIMGRGDRRLRRKGRRWSRVCVYKGKIRVREGWQWKGRGWECGGKEGQSEGGSDGKVEGGGLRV